MRRVGGAECRGGLGSDTITGLMGHNGDVIALGCPLSATGTRLATTLCTNWNALVAATGC